MTPTIQSGFDDVVESIGLTAREIIDTCGSSAHGCTTSFSSNVDASECDWELTAVNERTKNSVQIGVREKDNNTEQLVNEFVVELKAKEVHILFFFEDDGTPAGLDLNKKNAHRTFIALSSLIGVRVGDQMTVKPNSFATKYVIRPKTFPMSTSALNIPGIEFDFSKSKLSKTDQSEMQDAILKKIVSEFNARTKTKTPLRAETDKVATSKVVQSEITESSVDDEGLKNFQFAETILNLIGVEEDMPVDESLKDMRQIHKDRQTIESALKGGYVADAPITIRHFAKFRNMELAKCYNFKANAEKLVLHSVGHIEQSGQYQVRLMHDTNWTQLEISKVSVFLRRLASDFQGEYQGWTLNE